MFIEGMLQIGEVNLSKLSHVLSSKAKSSSCYKRLCRFVGEVWLEQRILAQFLLSMFDVGDGKWRLAMDRTNWKIGRSHVSILYLSVCYKGMGIPLFWVFLEDKKQGNSDHIDRIDLLEFFIGVFGKDKIGTLLMDREFCGKEWLDFLSQHGISYVLRLKDKNSYIANSQGKQVKIQRLFHNLKPGEIVVLGKRKVGKSKHASTHHITAMRLKNGELLILAHTKDIKDATTEYRYRWNIEHMFKAFKSAGFNLEDTRIINPDKLQTLTSVMAIAFCAAYQLGDKQHQEQPIETKKHGYKQYSLFRHGLNIIRNSMINHKYKLKRILKNLALTTLSRLKSTNLVKNVQ